jgi:hypothetical protein
LTSPKKIYRVIDPRPAWSDAVVSLAERPRSLDGKKVLLFDNGKLTPKLGQYEGLFDALTQHLHQRYPGAETVRLTRDLLVEDVVDLAPIADEVVALGVAGVIFALNDFGVSQLNVKLASELETVGIPTSLICYGVGFRQAASRAAQLIPGLPLTLVTSPRWASRTQVVKEAMSLADEIVDGLTGSVELLRDRFLKLPITVTASPEATGFIEISGDDPTREFTAIMTASGLGDGLPLMAPFPQLVEAMLAAAEVEGESEVWPPAYPRPTPVTAREVATLAVMAGCSPRWFRVVLAAYRAMAAPEFRVFQAAITTHAAGTLVLVSGPATKELELAHGPGCLGPGYPANATIGRAVALSYTFCLGARLGIDLSLQGSPAEYSYCCAEDLDGSPWPGLHSELIGTDATTVTVLKCEGPHSVMDNVSMSPESLLTSIASVASTLGSNNCYNPLAQTVVFLNLDHARLIASAGWSKDDARRFLFERVRHNREVVEAKFASRPWPRWFRGLQDIPVVTRPEDFLLVVAGGPGQTSQVAIPWGYSRGVTVRLT